MHTKPWTARPIKKIGLQIYPLTWTNIECAQCSRRCAHGVPVINHHMKHTETSCETSLGWLHIAQNQFPHVKHISKLQRWTEGPSKPHNSRKCLQSSSKEAQNQHQRCLNVATCLPTVVEQNWHPAAFARRCGLLSADSPTVKKIDHQ